MEFFSSVIPIYFHYTNFAFFCNLFIIILYSSNFKKVKNNDILFQILKKNNLNKKLKNFWPNS